MRTLGGWQRLGVVLDSEINPYIVSWQPVDLFAKGTSSYVRDFEFKFVRFVIVLIGPAISVWLLAIAAGLINQGFKDKPIANILLERTVVTAYRI